jgi:hypothetical protein
VRNCMVTKMNLRLPEQPHPLWKAACLNNGR